LGDASTIGKPDVGHFQIRTFATGLVPNRDDSYE
jgi:hypothetical protein